MGLEPTTDEAYETSALPIELRRHAIPFIGIYDDLLLFGKPKLFYQTAIHYITSEPTMGFEPMTCCLPRSRSSN
jgi:hypothetical protein